MLVRALQVILVAPIRLYQRVLSPILPPSCRYYPSCSEYTAQSILKYGPLVGLIKGTLRILRCHPFHPGGYDPIEYGWPEHGERGMNPLDADPHSKP